jgi:hypothetical protein
MDWPEFFKHFALYSTLSTLFFGILLYSRTKGSDSSRMSYSATTSRANYFILGFGLTISGGLLALNVYGYMLQRTAIPFSFFWLFGAVFLCLFILAWVPASKGYSYVVHYWAAWIKTYLMFAVMALMYVDAYDSWGKSVSMVNEWLHIVGIGFLLVFAIVATYTNQKGLSNKKSLHSQQLLYVIFLLSVLARIYL